MVDFRKGMVVVKRMKWSYGLGGDEFGRKVFSLYVVMQLYSAIDSGFDSRFNDEALVTIVHKK